jgi:hypothetical protein
MPAIKAEYALAYMTECSLTSAIEAYTKEPPIGKCTEERSTAMRLAAVAQQGIKFMQKLNIVPADSREFDSDLQFLIVIELHNGKVKNYLRALPLKHKRLF